MESWDATALLQQWLVPGRGRELCPCGFHAVGKQQDPGQLLAAVEPRCTPMSRPLSSVMLSPQQLATASVDCGSKLLAVSDAEDGARCLVHENLHLWPRSSRSLGFLDLARSCQSLPDLVIRQRLAGLAGPSPRSLVHLGPLVFIIGLVSTKWNLRLGARSTGAPTREGSPPGSSSSITFKESIYEDQMKLNKML